MTTLTTVGQTSTPYVSTSDEPTTLPTLITVTTTTDSTEEKSEANPMTISETIEDNITPNRITTVKQKTTKKVNAPDTESHIWPWIVIGFIIVVLLSIAIDAEL